MAKAKVEFLSQEPSSKGGSKWTLLLMIAGLTIVLGGLFWFLNGGKEAPAEIAQQANPQPEVILRIHGSNTLGASLIPKLAEAYLKKLGAVTVMQQSGSVEVEKMILGQIPGKSQTAAIEIEAHGSSTGFKDLEKGVCDIAASSRPIKTSEVEVLGRLGMGQMTSNRCESVTALDGVAIIVNPENPLNRLDVETVAKVFSGEISNWREIGEYDGPISVYARDRKSGTFDTFQSIVMGKTRVLSNWAVRFEDSVMLYESVMNDPLGIGFIGLPYIRQSKALAINEPGARALRPNYMSVKSEDYALARRLFLYSPEFSDNPHVAEFVKFARSDEGQRLVRAANLVDLALDTDVAQLAKVDRVGPERYQSLVRNAEFVVTVRFKENENALDNRALDDLARFSRLMTLPQNRHRQVILVGHTDISGDEEENLGLSRQRARSVAQYLTQKGIDEVVADGFGVDIPVASNESPKGRQRNRRVEIFLGV